MTSFLFPSGARADIAARLGIGWGAVTQPNSRANVPVPELAA